MTVLLDTSTVLWATLAPANLTPVAMAIIADEKHTILVSAVTAWEIATKVRKGKLPEAAKLESVFLEKMREAGYALLAIRPEDALRAGRLPGTHRDPFDRMLAAQALAADMALVSNDEQLDQFGVRRLW